MATYKTNAHYGTATQEHAPVQRMAARRGGRHQGGEAPIPTSGALSGRIRQGFASANTNHTGIPSGMKQRLEQSYGFPLDDVQVHYGSSEPEKLGAQAYTQGTQVHIGPGQEEHLGHELGHVIQQKQGRVAGTARVGGAPVNESAALEQEADRIGAGTPVQAPAPRQMAVTEAEASAPIQMKKPRWREEYGRKSRGSGTGVNILWGTIFGTKNGSHDPRKEAYLAALSDLDSINEDIANGELVEEGEVDDLLPDDEWLDGDEIDDMPADIRKLYNELLEGIEVTKETIRFKEQEKDRKLDDELERLQKEEPEEYEFALRSSFYGRAVGSEVIARRRRDFEKEKQLSEERGLIQKAVEALSGKEGVSQITPAMVWAEAESMGVSRAVLESNVFGVDMEELRRHREQKLDERKLNRTLGMQNMLVMNSKDPRSIVEYMEKRHITSAMMDMVGYESRLDALNERGIPEENKAGYQPPQPAETGGGIMGWFKRKLGIGSNRRPIGRMPGA